MLHTLVRGDGLMATPADRHIKIVAEAHQPGVTAFILQGIRRVLWVESQHGASMAAQLLALHRILIGCMAYRRALVTEDGLRCNMCGAATGRSLACLTLRY